MGSSKVEGLIEHRLTMNTGSRCSGQNARSRRSANATPEKHLALEQIDYGEIGGENSYQYVPGVWRMNRFAGSRCSTVLPSLQMLNRSTTRARPAIDREHTAWVASALRAVETIQVGMTRSGLMKVFTTEGRLLTTSQDTQVPSPVCVGKVDVKFCRFES